MHGRTTLANEDSPLKGIVVSVNWVDATVYPAWRNDGPSNWTPERCFSVGIIISADEDTLVIAQTVNDTDISTVLVIPQGCIEDFEVLHDSPIRFGVLEGNTEAPEDHSDLGATEGGAHKPSCECDCS